MKKKMTCINWLVRNRAGKDGQQVRTIKDIDGNVLTSEESELRRSALMSGENESEEGERKVNESGSAEDRLVEGVSGTTSGISFKSLLVCSSDGKSGRSFLVCLFFCYLLRKELFNAVHLLCIIVVCLPCIYALHLINFLNFVPRMTAHSAWICRVYS